MDGVLLGHSDVFADVFSYALYTRVDTRALKYAFPRVLTKRKFLSR